MAKTSGLPNGKNLCNRCNGVVKWEDKVLIRVSSAKRDERFPNISSNHHEKVIKSFSLCKKCYEEYQKFLNGFLEV